MFKSSLPSPRCCQYDGRDTLPCTYLTVALSHMGPLTEPHEFLVSNGQVWWLDIYKCQAISGWEQSILKMTLLHTVPFSSVLFHLIRMTLPTPNQTWTG